MSSRRSKTPALAIALVVSSMACVSDRGVVKSDAVVDVGGQDIDGRHAGDLGPDGLSIGDLGPWPGQPKRCGPIDRPCFFGATFADCGDNEDVAQPPLIYCSTHKLRCVWVSDGCPTGNYRLPFGDGTGCWCVAPGCNVGERGLHWLFATYGEDPWTRDRGLVIPTEIADGPPPATALPTVSCQNLGTYAWKMNGVCNYPGWLVVTTYDTTAFRLMADLGVGSGWHLEIEVDTGGAVPLARVCRLYGSDYIGCGAGFKETPCATSGEVKLVHHEGTLHLASFRAEFADGAVVSGTTSDP